MRLRELGRGVIAAAAAVTVVAGLGAPASAGDGGGAGARPEVTGPVTGGAAGGPINATPEDVLARYDYREEEYFLSGEATSYAPRGELRPNGRWRVAEADTAPYTIRVLVRRPADLDEFSGTVVVEWFNVTGGLDADPTYGLIYPAVLRRGHAYVAVSAQRVGIEGGGPTIELPDAPAEAGPLKARDPERYGSLSHPGDDYSYDIVTQAARAARAGDLLEGTKADRVLLAGQSQSAGRIAAYINAVHPTVTVYDGFLVHSRGDGAAPVAADAAGAQPEVVRIRTDLDEPVLQFETEGDLARLGFVAARQPDTGRIVTWEVAGTAHADDTIVAYGQLSTGIAFDVTATCGSVNTGPHGEVLRAAFVALDEWVTDGTEPPRSPRIDTEGDEVVRDEDGIVVGGIRTPAVDAPVSVLSGVAGPDAAEFCGLFGSETPFTAEQLAARYPTHDEYVDAVIESADAARRDGFLLRADRNAIVADAREANVPG